MHTVKLTAKVLDYVTNEITINVNVFDRCDDTIISTLVNNIASNYEYDIWEGTEKTYDDVAF